MEILAKPGLKLAVLPMGESPGSEAGDDYFHLGFVEDLIADLSRFSNLGIISTTSSFSAPLRNLSDERIAQELEADLILKTRVRRHGDTLRITAQLLDPGKHSVLWAERYDTPADHVFALQDELVEKISAVLSRKIDSTTLATARRKPITELAAYDCWLRGLDKLREGSIQTDEEARELFELALEADPQYSRAYAGLSLSHFNEWSCQQWEFSELSECRAFQYAREAARLDPDDHVAHLVFGRVYLFRREFEKAREHLDRALEINPNDADHLVQIASCLAFLGDAPMGARLFERARTLNPFCDPWYFAYGGFIQIMCRNFEDGILMGLKAPLTAVWIDHSAFLALAHACNGNPDEAAIYRRTFEESFREKILEGRPPEPGEATQWLLNVNPFRTAEDSGFYLEGLLKAGFQPPPERGTADPLAESVAVTAKDAPTFRADNNLRTMIFAGRRAHLPEVKGFGDLEQLLSRSGEEVHCAELMGAISADAPADEVLDARARAEYGSRIRELQADLEEAEESNDPGRAEKVREELDPLLDHLSRSVGIGGRSRRLAAPAERARSAVTLRIRSAIRKIEAVHPDLGRHLTNSVRTGTFCSYCPEQPLDWVV